MKKNRIFTSTLIVASFTLSVPALATSYTLGNDSTNIASDSGSANWSGDTFTISSNLVGDGTLGTTGYKGSWIGWSSEGVENASVKATITGSGFLGIAFKQGSGGHPTTIDLTNINVESFSGQLCVVNVWNENTTVQLSGEQWAGVEYIFGGLTREWENDTTVGAGTWDENNVIFTRGIESSDSGNDKDRDILALQGNTTLAGVSGTSKDFYVGSINLAADEYITVTSEGTTLTIAGSSTYGFYGTVGSDTSGSVVRASIVMNSSDGNGSQTFGGTNYLYNVTVTKGTLALEGVTNIAGSVTVATDSTLELGGEITLSNTISNSGTVVIADGTSFVLDNLTAGHVEGTLIGYYEIVTSSGGSITYAAEGGTYTFVHNGTTLSDWNIYVDENGNVYAYGESGEFTWNGTNTNNNWSTSHEDQPWLVGGTDSSYFVNGSDVTFGTIESGSPYYEVNITEGVTAGTIAVNDNYTFVFADGIKVEAGYVDVASGKTLTLQLAAGASSAEFHMDGETWYQFFSNANSRENHGTVEIGAGVTFYLSDSTETATIGSANYGAVVTGTGTLSVETTGQIGLYLPEFQGTVIFREGTTIRIGHDNDSYGDTGIYGASSTLVFESGSGITLISDLSSWTTTGGDYRVKANLVFEEGSHTIATGGHTAEFSGTISGENATITISGAGNLTFSGGGAIGTVTINAGATLVFSGDSKTYTIATITKSGSNTAGTLEVDAGTTVNAGTLNGDWHIGTIQVDGVLNISGTAEFGSGAGNTELFTGTGTVTVGEFRVGHGSNPNNGATVEIDGGLTFIANTITTGVVTNNSHLQLGNATFGTSNSSGLTFATTITEVTLTASGDEGKTTFNTSLYDVTTGKFTENGTTITIGVSVVGGGDIEVTGNGTLALSGTSTLGSVTVDSGATLDLSGGTVSVSSTIQNSGTVVVDSSTVFVLDNLTGTESGSGTTYVIITDGGTIVGWGNLDYSNFSYNGETLTSGRQIILGTDGSITYDESGTAQNLVWNGDASSTTWTNNSSVTNWTNGSNSDYFASGDSVTFDDTASSKNVTIGEAVKAGSITISDDYTFTFTAGGSVSSDSWTINSTLTLAGEGTVKFGSGTIDVSKIANAEGSNVTLEFVAGTWNSSSVTSTTNIQFSSSATTLTNDIVFSGSGAVAIGLESGASIEISGKVTSGENVTIYRAANSGSGGDVLTFSGEVDIQGGYDAYRGMTKFSGGGYIGTITLHDHNYTDGVTFSGASDGTEKNYTVETITITGSSNNGTVSFAVDSGATVDVGAFTASWGFNSITVDGTLNVSGTMNLATGSAGSGRNVISGSGTLNVGTLNVGNVGSYTFSGLKLNIGSGGITTANSYTLTFGDGLTVGVYAGNNENKAWSSSANITLSGSVTFNPLASESIALSGTISGEGNLTKTGDGTLTISNYTVSGTTTVSGGTLVLTGETILGGSAEIHVETGATLDLTGVTKTQNGTDTMYDILYIEGGTVTVQNLANGWSGRETNFGSAMYNGMLQISNGGVLDVTAAQTDADLSGEKRGFAVTSGEGTYRFSGTGTSYIVEDGSRTIHLGNAEDNATLIFDVVNSGATLDVSMAIAYGLATDSNGESATKSTSTGSLVKTGAGTLILEAANNYSGGTTIKEGVLVAASSGALGSGTVKIEGGAQLSIGSNVTITNSVSVTLSNTYLVSDSVSPASAGSGQVATYANGEDGIYAITGTGTLNTTITLFIDDTIAKLLAEAGEEGLAFYLVDTSGVSEDSSFTVSLSEALSGYTYTYDDNTGILWVAPLPEPELFSIFFGLGAIGLVATRRRKRRA